MNNEMKPHPHKALIDQWSACPEWWDVYRADGGAVKHWYRCCADVLIYGEDLKMKLEKSDKHPDNIKPKKRLIDWQKMPRGTMTNRGSLLSVSRDGGIHVLITNEYYSCLYQPQEIRLAEQTQFTYWGGGECPVPEGVIVEVVIRRDEKLEGVATNFIWYRDITRNNEIIAYRITGLADGWTDN
jgi:hypothetical protein